MSWFIIALVPPLLWAISNHIDKYLLSRYLKSLGFGSLILFSSFIGVILLPIILIIEPNVLNITLKHAVIIIVSGMLYIASLIPYFISLIKEEASRIAPFFQTIPIFGYFLGYFFFKETLTPIQFIGSLLIFGAAISFMIEKNNYGTKIKKSAIGLMLLSSLLIAINYSLFKLIALQEHFWQTTFWEYIGFTLAGIILFITVKSYRHSFIQSWKHNATWILTLNSINEIVNLGGKSILAFAILSAPLAIVLITANTQPFFVFIIAIFLTVFFPKWGKENISKKVLLQKIIAIIILFIGSYLLNK